MCIGSQSELKHEVRKKHFIDNLSICPNTEFLHIYKLVYIFVNNILWNM